MSDKIKLTYFDLRGRAEISRLVLAYSKKPYEDVRIQFQDWDEHKSMTPLGTLPVLEIGGQKFSQGLAIATYLAKECGLYGKNNMDDLMIDQIQQLREDLLIAEARPVYAKDETLKAEYTQKLTEVEYPRVLTFFNKVIKENPAKSGFAVGKDVTLADIVIFEGTESLNKHKPEVLDKFPEIKALRAKVAQLDGIKRYLATRKETEG